MTTVNTQENLEQYDIDYSIENLINTSTNIRFDVTAAGYALLIKNNKFEDFHNFIKSHFKGGYLICLEIEDKDKKSVKPHLHIWISDINIKKNTFRDQLIKKIPCLKRVGKTNANTMSQITNMKEPIQFYYLLKNYTSSTFYSNYLLNNKIKKNLKDIYLKLKHLNDLGESGRFYRYCHDNLHASHHNNPSKLISAYLDYCVSTNKKRINYFDCTNNINYILARTSPDTLITSWVSRYSQ